MKRLRGISFVGKGETVITKNGVSGGLGVLGRMERKKRSRADEAFKRILNGSYDRVFH